jgi:hypothetical protein
MGSLQQVIISNKTEHDFRFEPSFGPYLKFLRERSASTRGFRKKIYNLMIAKFEAFPELLKPFAHSLIRSAHFRHLELVELSLLPLVSVSDDHPFALAFMQPETIFITTMLSKNW